MLIEIKIAEIEIDVILKRAAEEIPLSLFYRLYKCLYNIKVDI